MIHTHIAIIISILILYILLVILIIKKYKESIHNNDTVFVIKGRPDLLGSFSQHVLYARFLAEYYGFGLNFSKDTQLDKMTSFESLVKESITYSKVSDITKKDHINNKTIVGNAIITHYGPSKKEIKLKGDTLKIQEI